MLRFYLSIVVLHYLQKCVPLKVSKTLLETYIILALRIHSLAADVYVPLLSLVSFVTFVDSVLMPDSCVSAEGTGGGNNPVSFRNAEMCSALQQRWRLPLGDVGLFLNQLTSSRTANVSVWMGAQRQAGVL